MVLIVNMADMVGNAYILPIKMQHLINYGESLFFMLSFRITLRNGERDNFS